MNTKKYSEEERKARDRAAKLRWYYKHKQEQLPYAILQQELRDTQPNDQVK